MVSSKCSVISSLFCVPCVPAVENAGSPARSTNQNERP